MNYKILVILSMIFFHIIDDFHLQGILASFKQKSWWRVNYPDKKYEYDWIISLFMHAFSWTFMINIPLVIYVIITGISYYNMLIKFIFNIIVHMIVDDLKCNRFKISLLQDQLMHILQILSISIPVLFMQ